MAYWIATDDGAIALHGDRRLPVERGLQGVSGPVGIRRGAGKRGPRGTEGLAGRIGRMDPI